MPGTHVIVNRDYWNGRAADWIAGGERLWALATPTWGIWAQPNDEVAILPDSMTGLTAIELGCGTGYVAGWMARRGAAVTAIDISAAQLATARRLAAEHGAAITWIEADAEAVPLPDGAFDFAVSEYGAAIWCDPESWLPEAWRLLRPGGTLVFLGNHPLQIVCTPLSGADVETRLHRPYRDLRVADFSAVEIDPGGIEFNRPVSDWMALFERIGFVVAGYRELFAPAEAEGQRFDVAADWARSFPSEQVWWLRKAG